jgi:hypothetical protein
MDLFFIGYSAHNWFSWGRPLYLPPPNKSFKATSILTESELNPHTTTSSSQKDLRKLEARMNLRG